MWRVDLQTATVGQIRINASQFRLHVVFLFCLYCRYPPCVRGYLFSLSDPFWLWPVALASKRRGEGLLGLWPVASVRSKEPSAHLAWLILWSIVLAAWWGKGKYTHFGRLERKRTSSQDRKGHPMGGIFVVRKNKLHQCWIVQFADLARGQRILLSSLTPSREKHKFESHLDSTYSLQRAKSFAAFANLGYTCLEIIRTYRRYIAARYRLNYVSSNRYTLIRECIYVELYQYKLNFSNTIYYELRTTIRRARPPHVLVHWPAITLIADWSGTRSCFSRSKRTELKVERTELQVMQSR
jgi:hypothetical protein